VFTKEAKNYEASASDEIFFAALNDKAVLLRIRLRALRGLGVKNPSLSAEVERIVPNALRASWDKSLHPSLSAVAFAKAGSGAPGLACDLSFVALSLPNGAK
jgi:hypothetical protein